MPDSKEMLAIMEFREWCKYKTSRLMISERKKKDNELCHILGLVQLNFDKILKKHGVAFDEASSRSDLPKAKRHPRKD